MRFVTGPLASRLHFAALFDFSFGVGPSHIMCLFDVRCRLSVVMPVNQNKFISQLCQLTAIESVKLMKRITDRGSRSVLNLETPFKLKNHVQIGFVNPDPLINGRFSGLRPRWLTGDFRPPWTKTYGYYLRCPNGVQGRDNDVIGASASESVGPGNGRLRRGRISVFSLAPIVKSLTANYI